MTSSGANLILSTDYELFFHDSGSIEKCLLEPTEALLDFTARNGMQMTFYVDTGMLRCFDRHSMEIEKVRAQLRRIAAAGHELGLHIHPHWEDTRLNNGRWDFRDTRYRLDLFSDAEIGDLLMDNHRLLQDLSEAPIVSYRAGGFCVEPFDRIAPFLSDLGIWIDSSVVPGARLNDEQKGFDFVRIADLPSWNFEASPLQSHDGGEFLEVAITPLEVSRLFYWGRLVRRLTSAAAGGQSGDGVSKAIGKPEVIRRLLGQSRVSELSMDHAKAPFLAKALLTEPKRQTWHIMGHPKLLSKRSLELLQQFVTDADIARTQSVSGFATAR